MKNFALMAALILGVLAVPAYAGRLYYGGGCGSLGGWDTLANFTTDQPPTSFPCSIGWVADKGEVYSDGTNWVPMTPTPSYSLVSFSPGPLTSITGTTGSFAKIVKASTVDNMVAASTNLVCLTNPTISMLECGTSATCTSPTTLGTVTLTTSGTAVASSLSSTAISAGDYVAWSISAGVCTSLNVAAHAQIHTN
jgi:hypothetical protein